MNDFVKSPYAAFGFLRHCDVRKSTSFSSEVACLASGTFNKAIFSIMLCAGI